MIFSLSNSTSFEVDFSSDTTDLFCFFHSQNSIKVPQEFWLKAVTSSLKLKKNVLILESPITSLPLPTTTARWEVGENYLWLAPRSLSVLLEASNDKSITYDLLKFRLSKSK
jgi:hypothetical protein